MTTSSDYSPKAAITTMLETLLQGVSTVEGRARLDGITNDKGKIHRAIEIAYDENRQTVMNADSGQRIAERVLDVLGIKKF
jgi:hypothetical protein